jgi:hypothetical protein
MTQGVFVSPSSGSQFDPRESDFHPPCPLRPLWQIRLTYWRMATPRPWKRAARSFARLGGASRTAWAGFFIFACRQERGPGSIKTVDRGNDQPQRSRRNAEQRNKSRLTQRVFVSPSSGSQFDPRESDFHPPCPLRPLWQIRLTYRRTATPRPWKRAARSFARLGGACQANA